MAETLGSLCDKITIIKLKQFHSSDSNRLRSLLEQETRITKEVDQFISDALNGLIPLNHLSFKANKVFKQKDNRILEIKGNLGELFALLANVNCDLWHAQEKVYEFEKVPAKDKNRVIKKLAILNLERNGCIDEIDKSFTKLLNKNKKIK
jgi:hypothetical protein